MNIEDLSIVCHPELIGSVFYNLINNGLKFNNSDIPRITCDHMETEKTGFFRSVTMALEFLLSMEKKYLNPLKDCREKNMKAQALAFLSVKG